MIQELKIVNYTYHKYVKYKIKKLENHENYVFVPFRKNIFKIEAHDITILPTLLDQSYEKNEIDSLIKLPGQKYTFLDVGANIGIYSKIMSNKLANDGICVAIEPNPQTEKILKENLNKSKYNNYHILNYALSDSKKKAELIVENYQGTGRLKTEHDISLRYKYSTKVNVSTLDLVIDKYHKKDRSLIIKIDVEGFEPLVIKGGHKNIRKYKPKILIEFSGKNTRKLNIPWNAEIKFLSKLYSEIKIFGPKKTVKTYSDNSQIYCQLNKVVESNALFNVLFVK